MLSPTELSLKHMRKLGYLCGKVEFWNPHVPPHGIRQDLFGIIDYVCVKPGEVVGLQICGYSGLSGHRKKALASKNLRPWLQSGSKYVIHAWKREKGAIPLLKVQELKLAGSIR